MVINLDKHVDPPFPTPLLALRSAQHPTPCLVQQKKQIRMQGGGINVIQKVLSAQDVMGCKGVKTAAGPRETAHAVLGGLLRQVREDCKDRVTHILIMQLCNNALQNQSTAYEAWTWLLKAKNLAELCGRKNFASSISTDGNSVSINLTEEAWSSPPKNTLPTPVKIKGKYCIYIDPGRRGHIGICVSPLTPTERTAISPTTTNRPAKENPAPCSPLFLQTFSNAEFSICNLSIPEFCNKLGFIQAQQKLNALKSTSGIHQIERALLLQRNFPIQSFNDHRQEN
ncbi:hypothetical protein BDK51DRAFT_52779 [Blyttiomyces helicus]|uniref:Uncharacterized protein n=1 Tax=Blyttiomyces helicus TaxID=388810 RepID=A0A4P9WMV4_9FUNG|nr:hypothetical protein BDK51DRAFT_52779 [Blyttiomyces helicus]|eukprot:RKO94399.1 hypothetical protein BDK51DRAFT_52779 [Blyttiomyces helicus]